MNTVDRYEPYRGHFPVTIPDLFRCAECGSKVNLGRAIGKQLVVACAINPSHEGLLTPTEWLEAHPPLADIAHDEAIALIDAVPEVRTAINRRTRELLWSE